MLKITTDKVYLTRGDSADINIVIKDSSGTVYELQSGDALTFTMKNNCETEDIVCQKDCTSSEQIILHLLILIHLHTVYISLMFSLLQPVEKFIQSFRRMRSLFAKR